MTTQVGRTSSPNSTSPTSPAEPRAPRTNDRVLFIAMNNSDEHRATLESDALKARGTRVTVLQDAKEDDVITTKDASGRSVRHDVSNHEGAMSFAMTLNLPTEQTAAIADALMGTDPDGKDEMAQLAQQWAIAELGGEPPSRLVLSGHHVGQGVYGDNNGMLDWPSVRALAKAMPAGARSVEDLLIAGCYSGGQQMIDMYLEMFPNAKTIVAYEGSSPGAASGATAHQKVWEAATRGTKQTMNRNMFAHMRKGENVTVWTKARGLDDGQPPANIVELKTFQASLEATYKAAFEGTEEIADPQYGDVRDYYTATQHLIQHPETTAAERVVLEARRDQTIRLLFYPVVAGKFQEANFLKLDQGYRAVGLTPPDFKTLKRAEAIEAIRVFEDKLAAMTPPLAPPLPDGTPAPQPVSTAPAAARDLAPILNDFVDLKRNVIPDTWV